jgi:hypothetical protein
MSLIVVFWQGLGGPDGINQVATFSSIERALQATRRGANQPYFGKKSDYWAYSPHEPKRVVLRGFPVLTNLSRREKVPEMGLFSLKIQTLLFPVSPTEDK